MARVARWYFFKPKIPIRVNFGGPYVEWKMLAYFWVIWNVSQPLGIFYGRFVMLWSFGIYFPVLVYCVKTNLATLSSALAATARRRARTL
jgi:hypothetical protein